MEIKSQKKKQINDLNNTQSEIQYKEHFYATENMVSLWIKVLVNWETISIALSLCVCVHFKSIILKEKKMS